MRRAWAPLFVLLASACSEPPSADVTHQAASRTVYGQQYDDCSASLRQLRDQRNRDHHHEGRAAARRDRTTTPEARAAAEAEVTAAHVRFEADRAAIRAREAECDALQRRMREVR